LLASALAAGLAAVAGLVLLQVRAPAPAALDASTPPMPAGTDAGPRVPAAEAPPRATPTEDTAEVDAALYHHLRDARAQVRRLTRDLEQSRAQIWRLNDRHRDTTDKLEQVQGSLKTLQDRDLVDLEALLRLGYHEGVEDFKRRLLARAIAASEGNRAEAARKLGLQRTYLYRLIKQLDLKP
jgi:hypothetical protein